MKLAIDRQPQLHSALHDLAREHADLEDGPLHLALLYDPGREPGDVFLFEVSRDFGLGEVDPDRALWEVAFGPNVDLPLALGQRLRLVLTNPNELEVALNEGWPSAIEVRDAVRRGDFEILREDETGRRILEDLR